MSDEDIAHVETHARCLKSPIDPKLVHHGEQLRTIVLSLTAGTSEALLRKLFGPPNTEPKAASGPTRRRDHDDGDDSLPARADLPCPDTPHPPEQSDVVVVGEDGGGAIARPDGTLWICLE